MRSGRCVGSSKSVGEGDTICEGKKTPRDRKRTNRKTEGRRTNCDLSLDPSLSSIGWARVEGTQMRRGKEGRDCLPLTGPGARVYIRKSGTVRDKHSARNGELKGRRG